MKTAIHVILLAALAAAAGCASGPAAALRFEQPTDVAERKYLGFKKRTHKFRLADIDADYVLLDVIDGQCARCQHMAPKMRRVYRLIDKGGLSGRIKVLGVATGNSLFVSMLFKDRYELPFPMVPDPLALARSRLEIEKTPHVALVRLRPDGPEVVLSEHGVFESPEAFFDRICEAAGISR
jgi:hypothetical protein